MVEEFVACAQLVQHMEVTKRQQDKFQRSLHKDAKSKDIKCSEDSNVVFEVMYRWVKNCSDRLLSDPELSVLKKSLNFAVTPQKVPAVHMETVTAMESVCRSLDSDDAHELKAKVL